MRSAATSSAFSFEAVFRTTGGNVAFSLRAIDPSIAGAIVGDVVETRGRG